MEGFTHTWLWYKRWAGGSQSHSSSRHYSSDLNRQSFTSQHFQGFILVETMWTEVKKQTHQSVLTFPLRTSHIQFGIETYFVGFVTMWYFVKSLWAFSVTSPLISCIYLNMLVKKMTKKTHLLIFSNQSRPKSPPVVQTCLCADSSSYRPTSTNHITTFTVIKLQL